MRSEKNTKGLWGKKLAVYAFGALAMTFGVALSIRAEIGVAPGSVVSYAVSRLTPLSVGICSSLFHVFCIGVQLLLTRRLTAMLVIQLPLAFVFGQLIDFFLWLLPVFSRGLAFDIMLLCAGLVIFSLGIRAIAGANLLLMPADNLARTAGEKLGWALPKAKLAFDIVITATGALLMLIFSGDVLSVIGIGTLICVAGTGPLIGLFTRLMPFLDVEM